MCSSLTPVPSNSEYSEADAIHNECLIKLSSTDQGMRRLKYPEIVRVRVHDFFTCVVPPQMNGRMYKVANATRLAIVRDFGRLIGV